MKLRFISVALTASVLCLCANPSFAADDNKVDAPREAASKAKANPNSVKREAKPKAAPQVKLVDINSATNEELKKLPGVSDVEASKIIAGRPYGSKAWLVSHKIIASGTYENLKNLVIAKQPNQDAAKNATLYAPKK